MTSVYINYPNPHFSLEHGRTVEERVRHDKVQRRVLQINPSTLEDLLDRLRKGEVRFAASRELNDLWLEIDFDDVAFEKALAEYVQRLLGARYRSLAHVPWR